MAHSTSSEYKVKCMAFLSYTTINDLTEYFHLSPIWGSDENIAKQLEGFHFAEKKKFDFDAIFDLPMDEQKCCTGCKHNCYVCGNEGECKNTVDCAKYPCECCGKVSNKCHYQQLKTAIIIFKSLLELCNGEEDYDCFEHQSDFVFPQFPFCYTIELLWDQVNTALEFCLDFLLKTGFLNDDTVKDRLMDFRLLLKRPKFKIAAIYGDEIIEMFTELSNERAESIITDESSQLSIGEEAPASESHYYNLPNGKKVWLKKSAVIRKTFVLEEELFYGGVFKFKTENRNIIKTQFQANGEGWFDNEQVSYKFDQGFLMLSTNNWEQGKRYDVRVLMSTSNDGIFDSIEYYGFNVKARCSQLNDEELKKNWKFDELKKLIKMKDVSTLQDVFSTNKKFLSMTDGSKNTLLHWAAQYSSPEVAELLLGRGIDAFSKNKEGATAYHQSASYNSVPVMKVLLNHSMRGLNEQDSDLYTPLHYACLNNCVDMARYLTDQNGINVDLRSKKGKKPDEIFAKTRDDIKKMITICRAKQ